MIISLPVPSWDSRIPFALVLEWNKNCFIIGWRHRSVAKVWGRETRMFRRLPRLSIGLEHIFLFSNRDPQRPLRRHIHLEV